LPIDLSEMNIDPTLPKYHKLLENLQANILKSHGRDESNHLLIHFIGDSERVKNWIRNFSEEFVTSARKQLNDTEEFKHGNPGGLVGSFYLSAKGYSFLGIDTNGFEGSDSGGSFRNGMKHRQFKLLFPNRDPRPSEWEEPYQGEIHAMVVLADDSDTTLQKKTSEVLGGLREIAQVPAIEHGKVLRNEKGESIEHFGYVDGRSNPVFLRQDIDKEINGGGIDKWDPSAPLRLVLIDDPFSHEEDSYGSYLVFRKLEQDVIGFNEDVLKLSRRLGTNQALAGAFAVGRFKDGTPVTLQNTDSLGAVNNFEYLENDGSGGQCPFHAHIRKANQRGANPAMSDEEERDRRIVRRGVPYGDPLVQQENRTSIKRGLLFMCFQSDISRQFEFIQRVWADNPNFPEFLLIPGLNTGDDSVIGQHPRGLQKWPKAWGVQRRIVGRLRFNFSGHVTLRGGEYFFAPSLSFLKNVV
jgi:Dyp-type peroxidase family